MIIIEQTLESHRRVFFEGVVCLQPLKDRLDLRRRLVQLGIGVGKHASIADASVGTQCHSTGFRIPEFSCLTGTRVINESALLGRVI